MTGLEALVLLLLTPLVPFALALAPPRWRRTRAWQTAAALAALPALCTSALMPAGIATTLPWLLEGSEFGLDVPGRLFLFFSAAIWLAAGVQARLSVPQPERSRFFLFFLFVMSGNLGLIVARDMLAFYLFFVLMSFAAYGLIVHDAGRESKRAGRVYITFVVAGDMLLFAALVLTALETGGSLLFTAAREAVLASPYGDLIVALLVLGFGVKLGLLGLHVTLPLIYRAAPIPAAAVLAGSVINAGLLAWLRFLPFGTAMPGWGGTLIVLGLAAALYGVLAGLPQRDAATVLGYSSISQIGVITAGTGAALAAGAQSPAIIAAVLVYAMHHAFAKGALFLGTGMTVFRPAGRASRIALRAGLLLPAAALAAAPLTSGMLAKELLKHSLEDVPHAATEALAALLPWTGFATTLIVARYLWLVWPLRAEVPKAGAKMSQADANKPQTRGNTPEQPRAAAVAIPWAAMLLLTAVAVWLLPIEDRPPVFEAGAVLETAWPVLAGTVLSLGVARAVMARRPRLPRVPPGDIVVLAESAVRRAGRAWAAFTRVGLPAARDSLQEAGRAAHEHPLWGRIAVRAENALGRWGLAMTLFVALAVLLAVATIRG